MKEHKMKLISIVATLCAATAWGEVPGVAQDEILLGTTTNTLGKSRGVAEEFNSGITAYINKINWGGGIYGRRISRIVYNDTYVPELTLIQTRRLVNEDHVFALIGYASTPGTLEILSLINLAGIPLIAPFSGAQYLRDPSEKHIFNYKVGYADQVRALLQQALGQRAGDGVHLHDALTDRHVALGR